MLKRAADPANRDSAASARTAATTELPSAKSPRRRLNHAFAKFLNSSLNVFSLPLPKSCVRPCAPLMLTDSVERRACAIKRKAAKFRAV